MKIPQLKPNLPLVLSLAVGLLLPALATAQDQTPLGTVARRQKAQARAKKVITDEDMPTRASERGPSPSAATSDTQSKAAPEADKPAKSEDKAEDKAKSETTETASSTPGSQDSPAAAPIRRKLNNLKQLEGLLQKKIEKVEKAMAEDSDSDHKSGYLETIEANKKALATTREDITATEKELAEANK
jgi:hypothetical protein